MMVIQTQAQNTHALIHNFVSINLDPLIALSKTHVIKYDPQFVVMLI